MKIPYNKLFNLIMRKQNPQSVVVALLLIAFIVFVGNTSFFEAKTTKLLPNQTVEGRVIKVIDGDTIDVLDNKNVKHRIRFYGIDAPESKQAYGQQARDFLASMIAGEYVKVLIKDKDRYGRNIGKVLLDGKDINREMVINGYAHAYTQYSSEYISQEIEARAFKLGLWKDKNPTKPSDFRKANR